mgnify:CR=1 FL=1
MPIRPVFTVQDLPKRKVIKVEEIAKLTGLSERTIRRAIENNEIRRAFKAPGTRRWLIPRENALMFMNGRAS